MPKQFASGRQNEALKRKPRKLVGALGRAGIIRLVFSAVCV